MALSLSSTTGPMLQGRRAPLLAALPSKSRAHARLCQPVRCAAPAVPFLGSDRASTAVAETVAPGGSRANGPAAATKRKTRVVVLGSGWGAVSFLKNLDAEAFGENGQYELILVSPRNHMVYTPLLPSAVGGVVADSSITESIRNIMGGKGRYFEARATEIDPATRTLTCVKDYTGSRLGSGSSGSSDDEMERAFTMQYDILVCSVGAVNATFGIPGVAENCWFLKSIEDAQKLRRHISKIMEHAALPDITPDERKRMLSFLVVGGGPTGVELAAELHDLISEDMARMMPGIKEDASITLVDGTDSLLGSYHEEIRNYAGEVFRHNGIKLRFGARVTAVRDGFIEVELKDGSRDTVPYGTCIWATGIAMHPLVAGLQSKLPQDIQNSRRGLLVDEHLRVLGTQGTIFCLGDAAVTGTTPQTSLPPTAQVARQEGKFLADLLSKNEMAAVEDGAVEAGADVVPLPPKAKPFGYIHLGSLAYLGDQKGAMDLPVKAPFLKTLRGYIGGQAWRTIETLLQVSNRTRWLVTHDWIRAAVFGRNLSDI